MRRAPGTALYCYRCLGCVQGNPKLSPCCGSAAFFRGRQGPRMSVQSLMPQERETDEGED